MRSVEPEKQFSQAHPVSLHGPKVHDYDAGMEQMFRYWGKTRQEGETWIWHPLVYHCLDVAACADAILSREPEATRRRMAAILGLEWDEARSWLLLIVACHDLGKACPGFQAKWPNLLGLTGLSLPRSPNTEINHDHRPRQGLRLRLLLVRRIG